MLMFHLPQDVRPRKVSKGVDPNAFQVQDPEPAYKPEPIPNHIINADAYSIMGWNRAGNFTASSMAGQTRIKTMRDMYNNMSIVNLTNDRRRRNF